MKMISFKSSAISKAIIYLLFTANIGLAESKPSPIIIGGIFDLTSEAAQLWGNAEREGVQLAIEDFRSKNPDVEVELKVEDSMYSNSHAVSAFHKLVSIDQADFITGPTWETFVAIMPLCEARKIICFAPSHNGSEFHNPARRYTYAFSGWFDERGYSDVVVEDIRKNGYKKVAVVGAISAYHDTLLDYLSANLKTAPILTERVPIESTDFRSIISKIPQDVEAIVMFLTGDGPVSNFLKQWSELRRIKPIFYGDDNFLYLTEASSKAAVIRGDKIFFSDPLIPSDIEARWTEKYKARFGKAPEAPSAAVAYDEATILLGCAKRDRRPSAVRDCIAATKNYQGMSGTITFDGSQSVTTRSFRLRKFDG